MVPERTPVANRGAVQLKIRAATDTGRVRGHNEDMVLVGDEILREDCTNVKVTIGRGQCYLTAIADGMGGHNAGEVASEMVLDLMRQRTKSLGPGLTGDELTEELQKWTHEIHCRILEEGNRVPERKGMGTTLVGVLFYDKVAYSLNVGDSRLYRLRDGCLARITSDHSLREITGDENTPANVIVNSFGGSDNVFIDFAPAGKKLFDGDVLLLCSDGLSDMLPDDEIERILTDCDYAPSALVEEANNRGGTDNISVVVVRIGDSVEY